MKKLTVLQLKAIQIIADGDYGLWTFTAGLAIKCSDELTFIEEFRNQLEDEESEEGTRNMFPAEIIEAFEQQ